MFQIDLSSALGIVVRTFLVYLVILISLRLSGKREIGQMTVFDLVVLLLIANAVQNAMVGPDTSLVGGVLAALVLLLVNAAVARLRLRWKRCVNTAWPGSAESRWPCWRSTARSAWCRWVKRPLM